MVPTAELHCHIEGAAPPELVRRLARRYGVDTAGLFTEDGRYRWNDFTSFLAAYDEASSVFRSPADYAELAHAYFTQSAREGMIYGEIFISPDHAMAAGLSYSSYLEGLAAGIDKARADTGIEARMIVIGVRHLGSMAVERAARTAASHPHPLVTGFGLAGDERQGRAADFARAFAIARDAGLGLTSHAGEFGGPESVRDALDQLGVKRLGHGVRAVEDPALVARLADDAIVLEVCPGSNVALGLYPSYEAHPVARLRAAGVAVTLNSDDPPFFDTSVAREYARTAAAHGWGDDELVAITATAIDAAFCDQTTKAALQARLSEAGADAVEAARPGI